MYVYYVCTKQSILLTLFCESDWAGLYVRRNAPWGETKRSTIINELFYCVSSIS